MSETHKESSEVQRIDDPKEPPDGGSTPDPVTVGLQTYPPPRGDDDEQ